MGDFSGVNAMSSRPKREKWSMPVSVELLRKREEHKTDKEGNHVLHEVYVVRTKVEDGTLRVIFEATEKFPWRLEDALIVTVEDVTTHLDDFEEEGEK